MWSESRCIGVSLNSRAFNRYLKVITGFVVFRTEIIVDADVEWLRMLVISRHPSKGERKGIGTGNLQVKFQNSSFAGI